VMRGSAMSSSSALSPDEHQLSRLRVSKTPYLATPTLPARNGWKNAKVASRLQRIVGRLRTAQPTLPYVFIQSDALLRRQPSQFCGNSW